MPPNRPPRKKAMNSQYQLFEIANDQLVVVKEEYETSIYYDSENENLNECGISMIPTHSRYGTVGNVDVAAYYLKLKDMVEDLTDQLEWRDDKEDVMNELIEARVELESDYMVFSVDGNKNTDYTVVIDKELYMKHTGIYPSENLEEDYIKQVVNLLNGEVSIITVVDKFSDEAEALLEDGITYVLRFDITEYQQVGEWNIKEVLMKHGYITGKHAKIEKLDI